MGMTDLWLDTIRPTTTGCSTILFLFNIFLPGVGTMLNQCCVGKGHMRFMGVFIGILQLLASSFILGWIWSIWWGLEMMRKSGAL